MPTYRTALPIRKFTIPSLNLTITSEGVAVDADDEVAVIDAAGASGVGLIVGGFPGVPIPPVDDSDTVTQGELEAAVAARVALFVESGNGNFAAIATSGSAD